jgi:hypothetical protein
VAATPVDPTSSISSVSWIRSGIWIVAKHIGGSTAHSMLGAQNFTLPRG